VRERELAEQRRVLADQYRILKSTTAAAATPGQQPWTAARPSATPLATPAAPASTTAASASMSSPRPAGAQPVSPARQGWPSARVTPTAAEAQAQNSTARWQPPRVYRPKRPSLWRRVKHTLLGSPEPALEDSL